MDDLPVTTIPAPTPPVYRSTPPRLLILLSLGFVIILGLTIILIFGRKNPSRPVTKVSLPTPITSSPATDSASISTVPPAPRLSLISLAGHWLITAANQKIWLTDFTPQGPRKSLLIDVSNPIVDLSLSPDRRWLAYTFADAATYSPGSPVFPKTGLRVLDLSNPSAQFTELIGLGDLSVRRPTWSSDSIYLALWNNGASDTLFDMTNKKRVKDIPSTDSKLGQIVFVPSQAKYSYIDAGTLYEVQYTVDTKVKVAEGLNSIFNFPNKPPLPDLHYYPTNTNYIIYHNSRGQLILLNRGDTSTQILAESSTGTIPSGFYPYGGVISYNAQGSLVYYNLGQDQYTPGNDDNPLYIFNLNSRTGQPMFPNRKTPISLTGLFPDPGRQHLLIQYQGFQVFSLTGNRESDCPATNLINDPQYSPETIWSTDSRYVLSLKTTQIADAFSCAITTEFDAEVPDLAVWLK